MKCIEDVIEEKEHKKKTKRVLYWIGSAVLTVGAVLAVPKFINKLSDKMYEDAPTVIKEEEDWGPEIVLKKKGDK